LLADPLILTFPVSSSPLYVFDFCALPERFTLFFETFIPAFPETLFSWPTVTFESPIFPVCVCPLA